MRTQLWAVGFALMASLLAAVATFQVKRGAAGSQVAFARFRLSPRVLVGVVFYLAPLFSSSSRSVAPRFR